MNNLKTGLLGIDVGSVSIDVVVIAGDLRPSFRAYRRHHGRPDVTLRQILIEIEKEYAIEAAAATGTGAERLSSLLGVSFVNEIIAHVKAAATFYPNVKTVIDIGGQDSKLIMLERKDGNVMLYDFGTNSMCAGGTGSFLDQQATRLEISIEEFSEMTLHSEKPPRMAGRCVVFAKSDMIHLQQLGTPDCDIVAGLCYALARNFRSSIISGKKWSPPVAFVGGVAANRGVVKAFEDVLGLEPGELVIPEDFALMGAIGAAVWLSENYTEKVKYLGVEVFTEKLRCLNQTIRRLEPLALKDSRILRKEFTPPKVTSKTGAYLGVDVGSISTNVVVMDDECRILAKRYLMTAGRPIEAVKQGLIKIGDEFGDRVEIKGVCTTGSGRYLTGDLIGADVVKNEITAHATATAFVDPEVDTIFEIGGQDSKYIHLTNGVIDDFTMNKVCAAGTGSFLEEQAEKLGLNISDFGKIALSANRPVDCGERCSVFMGTEVIHHQQAGVELTDIVAGLAYSIVQNYLNKVVEKREIGDHIFFQGGVAFNDAVVAALEKITGKPIIVPEHHEVIGAIGCCLIARDWAKKNGFSRTMFKGFRSMCRDYSVQVFECDGCPNHCEIKKVVVLGEQPLYYGGRCEKYEIKKKSIEGDGLPDLFTEREKLLLHIYDKKPDPKKKRGVIGYPRVLTFYEIYPFFKAFFTEIGFEIKLSPQTNSSIISEGTKVITAEMCFPVKAAHGHVSWMKRVAAESKVDFILLPSVFETYPCNHSQPLANHCFYTKYISDIVDVALELEASGFRILKPMLHFRFGEKHLLKEMTRIATQVGVKNKRAIEDALKVALDTYHKFIRTMVERGCEVLANLGQNEKAVVLVGKPHSICDPGTNLNLPKIWKQLGITCLPLDYLDLYHSSEVHHAWGKIPWVMGQWTLVAADLIRRDSRLYAVHVTNYGCMVDSMLSYFLPYEMGGKPYLSLELDEHSSEGGVVTRCEAFLDSLSKIGNRNISERRRIKWGKFNLEGSRILYIPYMGQPTRVFPAVFRAFGIKCEMLPEPDDRSLYWANRYSSRKECYACTLIMGDTIKKLKDGDTDKRRVSFYLPESVGSCRWDHYNILQRIVLQEIGAEDVPTTKPGGHGQSCSAIEKLQTEKRFAAIFWPAFIAADILEKMRLQVRPYELNTGDTDRTYEECMADLLAVTENQGDFKKTVVRLVNVMKAVPVDRSNLRPIIGIVGENYIRQVDYSCNFLIKSLEEMGTEVRKPPVSEFFWYLMYHKWYDALIARDWPTFFRQTVRMTIANYKEYQLRKLSVGAVSHPFEPRIWDVVENSGFTYEVGVQLGDAIALVQQGVAGVINPTPFNCTPSMVVLALSKKFRERYPRVAYLTTTYDGQKDTESRTRLEAFVHQCKDNALANVEVENEARNKIAGNRSLGFSNVFHTVLALVRALRR